MKTVTAEELMEWVENSVVAFALSLGWGQGSRHDVALAAAGWMARRSIPVERAVRIIECVAASDGREIHDRRA
ncbi:MAG TPA: hypothetical protein VMW65_04470, partial [Chloroflexota bacterium]|nr:hypothetical protein [Chloroflexota bacterium]